MRTLLHGPYAPSYMTPIGVSGSCADVGDHRFSISDSARIGVCSEHYSTWRIGGMHGLDGVCTVVVVGNDESANQD